MDAFGPIRGEVRLTDPEEPITGGNGHNVFGGEHTVVIIDALEDLCHDAENEKRKQQRCIHTIFFVECGGSRSQTIVIGLSRTNLRYTWRTYVRQTLFEGPSTYASSTRRSLLMNAISSENR
jgi:hypothetical protein